jgi:G-protein alpha subunit
MLNFFAHLNHQNVTEIVMSAEFIAAVKVFWAQEIVKSIWEDRFKIQVIESGGLFLNRIDEITAPSYKPSRSDIVLVRQTTIGIRDDSFIIDGKVSQCDSIPLARLHDITTT